MKKSHLILLLSAVVLFGCFEDEKPDPRKTYPYHVFIRANKSGRAFYAGSTVGLGSCAIIGRRTLSERSADELGGDGWSVVCCWYTGRSQCQEEHRYQDKDVPYKVWQVNPEYHIKPWRQYFFK